jgi:DNA repair exonuclease SbcCD ATPase subunit
MSRLVLLFIFWIMLAMAATTVMVPHVIEGGLWGTIGSFFEDSLATDMQKRDIAIRRSRKLVKNYIDMLKELYGTRFLMAEDAADLAERYAMLVQRNKPSNASAGVADGYVSLLQSQGAVLPGMQGEAAVELSGDMINNFRNLERRLDERQTGREVFQAEIDKLATLRENYAKGLAKVEEQGERIRSLYGRIRQLNGRISEADRLEAERQRFTVMQEQMRFRAQAAQEKAQMLHDELQDIHDRQTGQRERIEAMQDRMNSKMGR